MADEVWTRQDEIVSIWSSTSPLDVWAYQDRGDSIAYEDNGDSIATNLNLSSQGATS